MTILPSSAFRKVSLVVRFAGGVGVIFLLASSFAVTDWLKGLPLETARRIAMLPPVSFLGIARTVWGRGGSLFDVIMTRGASAGFVVAISTAVLAYSISFRRSFMRIPEISDAGPLPRMSGSLSLLAPIHKVALPSPPHRACYQFVGRTLLRSQAQLQIVLGFAAVGVVVSAEALNSAGHQLARTNRVPPVELLSIPFVMSYCMLLGIRLAFEMPLDIRANWIFRMWLDPKRTDARAVARYVLLAFSLSWLGPTAFLSVLYRGWTTALLHTLIWATCTAVFAEILLFRFRKIPFTYPYPQFQSSAPVTFLFLFAGFFVFSNYLPQFDQLCLVSPGLAVWIVVCAVAIYVGVYCDQKQLFDADKRLIFEDEAS